MIFINIQTRCMFPVASQCKSLVEDNQAYVPVLPDKLKSGFDPTSVSFLSSVCNIPWKGLTS